MDLRVFAVSEQVGAAAAGAGLRFACARLTQYVRGAATRKKPIRRILQGCGERYAVKLRVCTDSSKEITDTLSKLALAFVGLRIS